MAVLGFIGTGTIASVLIHGFMRVKAPHSFVVSPRSESRAKELKAEFPDRVTVMGSNQQVADAADVVFVCVLPKQAEEVYTSVKFKKDAAIVNVVTLADPVADVRRWTGGVSRFAHIIPLAFVSEVDGPIVLYPDSSFARELLSPLGTIVPAGNLDELHGLSRLTGLEAPYFTVLREIMRWSLKEGLEENVCLPYLGSFFAAMSAQCAISSREKLEQLAEEFTPGGLNYTAKKTLEDENAVSPWSDALDAIKELTKS